MNANQATQNHFNLHLNGVGYLNRVRWVTVGQGRKAEPFLSCSIAAMRGEGDKPDYTYLDLKVVGEDAINLIDSFADDANNGHKVVVSFKVSDIYTHLYERESKDQNGNKTGMKEPAALIKGRLLLVYSVTVDGERVYTRPSADESGSDQVPASGEQQGESGNDQSNAAPQGGEDQSKSVKTSVQASEPVQQPRQPVQQEPRAAQSAPRRSNYRPQGRREAVPA